MAGFGFGLGFGAGVMRRDGGTPTPSPTAPAQIPTITATPGDGQAVLTWTAPSDGGSAITDYTVQYKLTSSGTWATFADGVSPVPGATVTGLTNGSAYDFRAAAVNAVGTGPWSEVASATPAGAATPTFILPYNNQAVQLGDSRTAGAGSGVDGRFGASSGMSNNVGVTSIIGWLTQTLGNKITPASFPSGTSFPVPDAGSSGSIDMGIGAQSVGIFTIPRPASPGTLTAGDAAYKGLDQIAAREPAIVVMLAGTNYSEASQAPGGQARDSYAKGIDYLTNPASTAFGAPPPLFGGKPKTLIIINEWPRGLKVDGSVSSGPKNMADFAAWLTKFDYASGDALANPHVVVIDAYGDSRITNPASGENYFNYRGALYDGLHQCPPIVYQTAVIAAERLNSLLAPLPAVIEIPTTATVSNFLNTNPLLSAGTPATVSGSFTGATVPAGWIASAPTGLSVDISYVTVPGIDGRVLAAHITGTIASGTGTVSFSQSISAALASSLVTASAGTPAGPFKAFPKLRAVAMHKVDLGPGSSCRSAYLALRFQGSTLANSFFATMMGGAAPVGANSRLMVGPETNANHDYLPIMSPLIDTSYTTEGGLRMGQGGIATGLGVVRFSVEYEAGTVDDWVYFGAIGWREVAG